MRESIEKYLEFRKATQGDVPEVVELLTAQLQEHSLPVNNLEEILLEIFRNPKLGMLPVALCEGQIVGVSYLAFTWTLEHGGRAAWLEEIYVKPEYRGKGIGEKLLRETLTAAKMEGCLGIDLEVDSDHQRAESLYKRIGFQRRYRSRWYFLT